jgi:hypothetical protein
MMIKKFKTWIKWNYFSDFSFWFSFQFCVVAKMTIIHKGHMKTTNSNIFLYCWLPIKTYKNVVIYGFFFWNLVIKTPKTNVKFNPFFSFGYSYWNLGWSFGSRNCLEQYHTSVCIGCVFYPHQSIIIYLCPPFFFFAYFSFCSFFLNTYNSQ